MNTAVMFGKATDEWATPQDVFALLDAEFRFVTDAAATADNAKRPIWLGPGGAFPDALAAGVNWGVGTTVWLNPPYSRVRAFIGKAAEQARTWRSTVVCLVPARTDTRWWHEHVWDAEKHQPRAGVEVRFIKGRLKFGDGKNSAPFPSVVIIFRGQA
jgi:phage N-6-adenine-methyltransferase